MKWEGSLGTLDKWVGMFYIISNKLTNLCFRFLFVQLLLPWTGVPLVGREKRKFSGRAGILYIAGHPKITDNS